MTNSKIPGIPVKPKTKEQAMRECPRFEKCSVNNCPLNTAFNRELSSFDCDKEHKCTLAKKIRFSIGKKYTLSNLGLKPREYQHRHYLIGANDHKQASNEPFTGETSQ